MVRRALLSLLLTTATLLLLAPANPGCDPVPTGPAGPLRRYPGPCVEVTEVTRGPTTRIDRSWSTRDDLLSQRTVRDGQLWDEGVFRWTYDDWERLVEKESFSTAPVGHRVEENEYARDGALLRTLGDDDGDGAWDTVRTRTYDGAGRLVRDELGWADGRSTHSWNSTGGSWDYTLEYMPVVWTHSYDAEGRLVRSDVDGYADGSIERSDLFFYDGDVLVRREVETTSDGTTRLRRYRHTYAAGRLVRTDVDAGEGGAPFMSKDWTWDAAGNRTSETFTRYDRVEGRTVWTWDDAGRVVSEDYEDPIWGLRTRSAWWYAPDGSREFQGTDRSEDGTIDGTIDVVVERRHAPDGALVYVRTTEDGHEADEVWTLDRDGAGRIVRSEYERTLRFHRVEQTRYDDDDVDGSSPVLTEAWWPTLNRRLEMTIWAAPGRPWIVESYDWGYYGDGALTFRTTWWYDGDGRPVRAERDFTEPCDHLCDFPPDTLTTWTHEPQDDGGVVETEWTWYLRLPASEPGAADHGERRVYDAAGRLVRESFFYDEDWEVNCVTYRYDDAGNLAERVDDRECGRSPVPGYHSFWTYDDAGNVLRFEAGNAVTTYDYGCF